MARQSGPTRKVKHIDIKFHFVKDHVEAGDVLLDYCLTKRMIADALTKPLPRERTETLRAAMGIVLVQSDVHISPRGSLMDNPASNADMASNTDMERYADVATKSEAEVATIFQVQMWWFSSTCVLTLLDPLPPPLLTGFASFQD
ncbi:hypothetical protein L7F22_054831 [Adiantum nelumboides]|nr:hypothetical protein [Adiantum nelumboides]